MTHSRNIPDKVPAYEGNLGFAFFSYSHADQAQLMPYFSDVSGQYRFWYDEGLKSGQEWVDEIGNKIYGCDLFVVFLSENALNSRYIKDEILFAYKYAKQTLAVFLEPVTLSKSLDFILGRFQHVTWYEDDQAYNYNKLVEGFPASIRIASPGDQTVPMNTGKIENGGKDSGSPDRAAVMDQYDVIRKLGEGGFSIVELVKAKRTGALYVMKRLRAYRETPERIILGKAVARNELQKLLLLSEKPYVPVLIDYFESEEDCFLVISRIAGLNLKSVLRRYPGLISREIAISLIYQIALILEDIHKAGLVYGDVKPSNFIIDTFGRLSLIDFGSTAALDDRNYLKIYTPQYAAPEQKEKQKKPDFRFDVYGLGAMLGEMLEISSSPLIPVYGGGSFFSDCPPSPYHDRGTYSGSSGQDSSSREMLDRILDRMTAQTPAARYANMGEVVAALELICPRNSALLLRQLADSIDCWDTEVSQKTEKTEVDTVPDHSPVCAGSSIFNTSAHAEPQYYTTAISTRPDFYYGMSNETVF